MTFAAHDFALYPKTLGGALGTVTLRESKHRGSQTIQSNQAQ